MTLELFAKFLTFILKLFWVPKRVILLMPYLSRMNVLVRAVNVITLFGAHLLLFFMAFVFGSFCTFCFHMMMYLFDEKCVLFPKLLSLSSLRHNLIYEFIPDEKMAEMLPVDFLSTHWVDKSACYLPTYVPLVSGIFGLVWTTMFLMCSASSRNLTGLQRPWRVLPPVFVFSILMGSLCIYSSAVTHFGLQELCLKLGEITGSTTCTYTVNVATLAYERRIRGVYQATRLTVASAWLHTACWLLSALLALVRVLLAVDFHLVRVTAHLQGDIDKMLERYERHVRTVTPDLNVKDYTYSVTRVHFKKSFSVQSPDGNSLYVSHKPTFTSEISLVPEEKHKLLRLSNIEDLQQDKDYFLKLLYSLLDSIEFARPMDVSSSTINESLSSHSIIVRQLGQERIKSMAQAESHDSTGSREYLSIDLHGDDEAFSGIKDDLLKSLDKVLKEPPNFESVFNITSDMKEVLEKAGTSKRDGENVEEKGIQSEPEKADDDQEDHLSTDIDANVDDNKELKHRKKEKQD